MPTKGESLADKVEASYLQLSAVASDLNTISDELGKSVADIDGALKKLNLGITVWVDVSSWDDEQDFDYYTEQIGYGKVDGKWGIALRTLNGNRQNPERELCEQWLFNDGPRRLRLASIEKIPDLLNKLSVEAVETTNKIKGRLADAKEVAEAVKKAAWGTPPKDFAPSPGQHAHKSYKMDPTPGQK